MVQISISTDSRVQIVDITSQVSEAVRKAGVAAGICVVYCPHTTAAITINENYDPDVKLDMCKGLKHLVPEGQNFRHSEGNSDSHIQTALVGPSQTLIIDRGEVVLGQWQGIFFCEFDGPRKRTFLVKTIGDDNLYREKNG